MLKKITKAELNYMTEGGTVLETEGPLFKVMLLSNRRIVKLFRRKRLISSQIWLKHATRFEKNSRELKRRGFITVEVESVFNVPEVGRQGVLYYALEGDTLRDWLPQQDEKVCQAKFEKFGAFIAEMHRKGILFRSLHLGNVLVLPDDEFGIIDIADMSFRTRGCLSVGQRIRNFHHMDRDNRDRRYLGNKAGSKLIQNYIEAANLSNKANLKLTSAFELIFAPYRDIQHV
jgi:tRNA A-37 threonylcarbamoyl transferase component Bud32